MIPYAKHYIDESDIDSVVKCLCSDYITQGPLVSRFEAKIAETVHTKYAVVFNSGTAALHCAYLATGLRRGCTVVTSPITFIATVNAALSCGAEVHYVDIDPGTYCLSPDRLREYVSKNKPHIVVPVHMGGKRCDMDAVMEIAHKHNSWVIEDACHSFSPYFRLKGHMACFSFHPAKHITTGEGGAVVTNDETLYHTLLALRDHGRIKGECINIIGYNYRLPDINCALGLSQIKKLRQWQDRRLQIAYRYGKAFKGLVQIPEYNDNEFHLYIIRIPNREPSGWGITRDIVAERLYDRGVGTQIHYLPVYRYRREIWWVRKCPEAHKYADECLSLPMYPTMTDEGVEYVIHSVREVLK